jgi:hypothetical protein
MLLFHLKKRLNGNGTVLFLISNFRRVLNVVRFLLGNSPASEFYMPTSMHINFRRREITQKKESDSVCLYVHCQSCNISLSLATGLFRSGLLKNVL